MRRPATATTLLSGLLVLAACGGQSEARVGTGDPELDLAGGGLPGWLERSVNAPFEWAFLGVRVVRMHHVPPGVEYREEVASDGQGNFTIDTLQVLSQHPNPDMFMALQDLRQTLSFRYRDFMIRDWDLFQQQYAVAIVDENRAVAGIPTVQVLVHRKTDTRSEYYVDFDPATGLVLAYQEYSTADGSLLADVSFESLEYGADLTGLELVSYLFPTSKHSLAGEDLSSIFEFDPLVPVYTPQGYTILDEIEKQNAPDGMRAKVYLTDGLEMIVLASQQPLQSAVPVASRVHSMQLGPWTGMMGEVDGNPVLIAGKTTEQELALILQSSLDPP